jgi:hypothetical protein
MDCQTIFKNKIRKKKTPEVPPSLTNPGEPGFQVLLGPTVLRSKMDLTWSYLLLRGPTILIGLTWSYLLLRGPTIRNWSYLVLLVITLSHDPNWSYLGLTWSYLLLRCPRSELVLLGLTCYSVSRSELVLLGLTCYYAVSRSELVLLGLTWYYAVPRSELVLLNNNF